MIVNGEPPCGRTMEEEMAKGKKKPQRIKRGARGLKIAPGKCRLVRGAVTVCVTNSGRIKMRRGKTLQAQRKERCVVVGKGESKRKLCPSKYAPTSKMARRLPKSPTSRGRRLQACRSNLFTNTANGNCSCVVVNKKGRLQVTPLGTGACKQGGTRYTASRALELVRDGKLKRPKAFDIKTPKGKVRRFRRKA